MEKFERVTGIAAPMPMINIDTDMIIPKQFLKTIKRTGLGRNLFYELRYTAEGKERSDFVLNKPAYRQASILVTGANFGCGSSREHAPWALKDFGIRCIIAPSFADIFYNNCFKNGILPLILPQDVVDCLVVDAENGSSAVFAVDIVNQKLTKPDGKTESFLIDPVRREFLLKGLDEIGLTESRRELIDNFEAEIRKIRPWQFISVKVF